MWTVAFSQSTSLPSIQTFDVGVTGMRVLLTSGASDDGTARRAPPRPIGSWRTAERKPREVVPRTAGDHRTARARASAGVRSSLHGSDVDLDHLQHGLHRAVGPTGVR